MMEFRHWTTGTSLFPTELSFIGKSLLTGFISATGTAMWWAAGHLNFSVRALTVTLVDNPGSVVIDQGAEPISAPCLLILNIHGLCTLYVLVYVGMMSQSSVISYY